MADKTFLVTGLISLVLTAALVLLSVISYVKKHPQWRVVVPIYVVIFVLNSGFCIGFLTRTGPPETSIPVLWWLLVTTTSASLLWRTGLPVLHNKDFKDAGVL